MALIKTPVDQLLLLSDIAIYQLCDCIAWPKDHRQLPALQGDSWCILLYLGLPQAVVVCEADQVVVCCGTAEAVGRGLLATGLLGVLSLVCWCWIW